MLYGQYAPSPSDTQSRIKVNNDTDNRSKKYSTDKYENRNTTEILPAILLRGYAGLNYSRLFNHRYAFQVSGGVTFPDLLYNAVYSLERLKYDAELGYGGYVNFKYFFKKVNDFDGFYAMPMYRYFVFNSEIRNPGTNYPLINTSFVAQDIGMIIGYYGNFLQIYAGVGLRLASGTRADEQGQHYGVPYHTQDAHPVIFFGAPIYIHW